MVRSMYSGVSGLRAHQTRMDTIGNNIANVNTYGFKSSRTTFRDIYYQTINSASGPSAAAGGSNASQVGYGSKVGSIDLLMGRSTLTMTGQTMDTAVDGDGFVQVMDSAGNIFYTRAGMLNFDAAGNLVDMQGNFVLGVNGDPTGRAAGSEKIQVALPNVPPTGSSVRQTINGKTFTITSSNNTTDANLNFNFTTDASLADDEVTAQISASGIIIKMNPANSYSSMSELNAAVNAAITRANGNQEHPGGIFTIDYTGTDNLFATPLTAAEITSTDFGIQMGSLSFANGVSFFGGVSPVRVGTAFSGAGTVDNFTCTYKAATSTAPILPERWELSIESGGKTYTATVDASRTSSGEVIFKNSAANADVNDTIVMRRPSFNDIKAAYMAQNGNTAPTDGDAFTTVNAAAMGNPVAKASLPSRALGFSGTAFALRGGTAGGPQTLADMTGISIAPNGIITGFDSQGKEVMIGRIDLATFANPAGLNQSGSSNFSVSANSGPPILNQPGTGGAGKLISGSLELSNVDLSSEFSDMITTQRGYQANSRIITVSDTMLEELINLKR